LSPHDSNLERGTRSCHTHLLVSSLTIHFYSSIHRTRFWIVTNSTTLCRFLIVWLYIIHDHVNILVNRRVVKLAARLKLSSLSASTAMPIPQTLRNCNCQTVLSLTVTAVTSWRADFHCKSPSLVLKSDDGLEHTHRLFIRHTLPRRIFKAVCAVRAVSD
jgi:hypothetical protein